MNEDKLYNLALIVLFILIAIQIFNMFWSYRQENMDPALLNHMYVDWPGIHDRNHIPAPQSQTPKFYLENDMCPKSPNQELTSPIITDEDLPCAPHFDWLVPQSLGAGNRYDDMLWSKTSPKMMLRDDCINCKKYADGKPYPNGTPSGLPDMLN